jgi:hypothetical protein
VVGNGGGSVRREMREMRGCVVVSVCVRKRRVGGNVTDFGV